MKLSEIKNHLTHLDTIAFELPNGSLVPNHFHVTEVGKITKHFIDCGGTVRNEEVVNFQLWDADDYDHRLHPEKLVHIIELSQKTLGIGDLEIEVEYQGNTIEKFSLDFDGKNFLLTSKQTDCLARNKCEIPESSSKNSTKELESSCCSSTTNCC